MTQPTKTPKPRSWGGIRHRKGRYYVAFRGDGRQLERGPFSSWKTADMLRNRARALLESGTPLADVLASVFGDVGGSGMSLRDAAPLYLAYAATRKKPSTLRGDTHRLRLLCAAPWAAKPLGRVEPRDLIAWTTTRQRDGASGATINRDLNLGSALFRWAIRAGHVADNPFRRVDHFSEKGRARETYLTADESRALIDSCSPVLRPLVLAALHTGARRGELLALRWCDVDLARRELHFRPETEKTGRGRMVALTDGLHSALTVLKAERRSPAADGTDALFVDRRGVALNQNTVAHAFSVDVRRCGGIALEKRAKVTFHTLRHTAASLMVAAGVPIFDVAKTLGHSTLAVTMRYAHFAPEAGRRAVAALSDALAGRSAASTRVVG